jgi:hypothetical protein
MGHLVNFDVSTFNSLVFFRAWDRISIPNMVWILANWTASTGPIKTQKPSQIRVNSVCPSQVNEVMFCLVRDIIDGFYIENKNKKIVKITL